MGICRRRRKEWKYPWGDHEKDRFQGVRPRFLTPTATVPANPLGIYDLGRVWEWVEDCYEAGGKSTCVHRITKGGSWSELIWNLRVANKSHGLEDEGYRGWVPRDAPCALIRSAAFWPRPWFQPAPWRREKWDFESSGGTFFQYYLTQDNRFSQLPPGYRFAFSIDNLVYRTSLGHFFLNAADATVISRIDTAVIKLDKIRYRIKPGARAIGYRHESNLLLSHECIHQIDRPRSGGSIFWNSVQANYGTKGAYDYNMVERVVQPISNCVIRWIMNWRETFICSAPPPIHRPESGLPRPCPSSMPLQLGAVGKIGVLARPQGGRMGYFQGEVSKPEHGPAKLDFDKPKKRGSALRGISLFWIRIRTTMKTAS